MIDRGIYFLDGKVDNVFKSKEILEIFEVN